MSSDVEKALEQIKPLFGRHDDPAGGELDPQAFLDMLADDITITFQGTEWPLGGSHVGKSAALHFFGAVKQLWEKVDFQDANFATADSFVMVEWFSHVTSWKGETIPNAGATVFEIKDGKIAVWREYTDTARQTEFLSGWQDKLGPEVGEQLPNWKVGAR
jgi:limonene-1,2-epoxide hydrolase